MRETKSRAAQTQKKTGTNDLAERFHAAQIEAGDQLEAVIVDGRLDFPDYTFANAIISWCSGVSSERTPEGLQFYRVEEETAQGLIALANKIPEFYSACLEICAQNTMAGAALPLHLRLFAAQQFDKLSQGVDPRVKGKGSRRAKDWLEKLMLWSLVHEIKTKFDLTVSRNDGSDPYSSCDAVAGALTIWGRPTEFAEIRNLMVHKNFRRQRAEFEAAGKIWYRQSKPLIGVNRLSPQVNAEIFQRSLEDLADIVAAIPKA